MALWDTDSLFCRLLASFADVLNSARPPGLDSSMSATALRVAREGFGMFCEPPQWGRRQVDFVDGRLGGGPSEDAVEWYGDGAEAIHLFSGFVYGALLGLYACSQIDDLQFSLGEAHLAGYLVTADERIVAIWQRWREVGGTGEPP